MRGILMAVLLGGAFGSASATVVELEDHVMVVEIEVEVLDTTESVVAHLSFDGEPDVAIPLAERDDGAYGIRTELEPRNYVVVFETVGEDGQQSEATTLAQMGAVLGPETTAGATAVDEGELSDESQRYLWLAVAAGAAALSLLAFWVLGGRGEEEEEE